MTDAHLFENDPRSAYDALHAGPLSRDDASGWVVAAHRDALTVVTDPGTYSSKVSRFLLVPSGFDGAAHREARELLDPFFAPERLAALEPDPVVVAGESPDSVTPGEPVDAVRDLGSRYAVRVQSVWLGWPAELEPELLDCMEDNHATTRWGELVRTAEAAHRFDAIIRRLLHQRRTANDPGQADVTAELMRLRHHDGRPFAEEEMMSLLRDWTRVDLGFAGALHRRRDALTGHAPGAAG